MAKITYISFSNFTLCLLFFIQLSAQTPTTSDCFGAIPVCDPIYIEDQSYDGEGNYESELHEDCCVEEEKNSVWYSFTTQNAGNLGFEIIPADLDDDYDWAVFNITNKSCADIAEDFSTLVSCNATGQDDCEGITGPNGGTIFHYQNKNCGTFPPTMTSNGFNPFNALIPVEANNNFVLLIVNWSSSPNGYTLDFTKGDDVGIYDITNPEVSQFNIVDNACGIDEIDILFSKDIVCGTFENTDITISGPGGPYSISISGGNCNNVFDLETFFTINITPPLKYSGDYTISINDDPLSYCQNPLIEFDTTLSITTTSEVLLDTTICDGDSYSINGTWPGITHYEWSTGTVGTFLEVDTSGIYTLLLENECEILFHTFIINFSDNPTISEVQLSPASCNAENGEIAIVKSIGDQPLLYQLDNQVFTEDSIFTGLSEGSYTITIKNQFDCFTEYQYEIVKEISELEIDLIEQISLPYGDSISVSPTILSDFDHYFWTGDSTTMSCTECLSPIFSPLITTSYTFHIIDKNGCKITKEMTIVVAGQYDIYVPNIFTPNNDGINDYFSIFGGKQIELLEILYIYDRWGNLVHQLENIPLQSNVTLWDGKINNIRLSSGVYAWYAEVAFNDGYQKKINGSITIAY